MRFEPGQERTVQLVALDGDRVVYGFNALVMGKLDGRVAKTVPAKKSAKKKGSRA